MDSTAKMPAVLQAALQLQNIDTSKCNLMLPTETYGEVLGMFDKITFESIKVNPEPAGKEVYEPDGPGKGKALGKVPLQKIGIALGIIWDPATTGIVEDTDIKSRAKATGAIRKPNGEYIVVVEEKTINSQVLGERDRLSIEERADKGNPDKVTKWGKTDGGKSYPEALMSWKDDAEKERWIDRAVRKAVIQHQLSKNEKANTGAKERVIRAFIAMKSTYTDKELSLPFVYPCVVRDTAKMLATPELQAAAIKNMGPSLTAIFGDRTDHDLVDVSPPKQIPRTVDVESGEVFTPAAVEEGQLALDIFDDAPAAAPVPEKTPEEKARAILEGYRAAIVSLPPGAMKLLETMLAKKDATISEINLLIDRLESALQRQKAGAA